MDWMTFFRACFNVLLKAPRLISAFVRRNLAFSSIFIRFPAKFSAKKSIKSVSVCVLVKLLFFANIFVIGSSSASFSHFWTFFLANKLPPIISSWMDTVLYTGKKRLAVSTITNVNVLCKKDLHRYPRRSQFIEPF